jgi:hypothetical protein
MFRRLATLAICLFTICITVPKLYTMCALRGWVPGAQGRLHRVTQKLVTSKINGPGNVYWVSWNREDIHKIGNHRIDLPLERWQVTNIGDPIEIITVGRNTTPFLPNDGFANGFNFGFDIMLLSAEVLGIVTSIRWLVILRGEDMKFQD